MNRRRRRGDPKPEPVRCVCQPGPDAHYEHSKPGRTAAKRFDPRCPHWDRSSVAIGISSRILSDPVRVDRLTKGLTQAVRRIRLDVAPDT